MDKNKGAAQAGWKTRFHDGTTLKNLGIDKKESHRRQFSHTMLPNEWEQAAMSKRCCRPVSYSRNRMIRVGYGATGAPADDDEPGETEEAATAPAAED